jgi:hypothetical protein
VHQIFNCSHAAEHECTLRCQILEVERLWAPLSRSLTTYYHHSNSDQPVGNSVAHLGLSKIRLSAPPSLHTSNTPLNTLDYAIDLQSTTSTQPSSQQLATPTHQQSLHLMHQTLDYIKILPSIPVGGGISTHSSAHSLLTPITTASTVSNYSKASEATANFLKAFLAALSILSITHGPGRSNTNRTETIQSQDMASSRLGLHRAGSERYIHRLQGFSRETTE